MILAPLKIFSNMFFMFFIIGQFLGIYRDVMKEIKCVKDTFKCKKLMIYNVIFSNNTSVKTKLPNPIKNKIIQRKRL
jgi:hypothetical protein